MLKAKRIVTLSSPHKPENPVRILLEGRNRFLKTKRETGKLVFHSFVTILGINMWINNVYERVMVSLDSKLDILINNRGWGILRDAKIRIKSRARSGTGACT